MTARKDIIIELINVDLFLTNESTERDIELMNGDLFLTNESTERDNY